jgi:hypothetical protein
MNLHQLNIKFFNKLWRCVSQSYKKWNKFTHSYLSWTVLSELE